MILSDFETAIAWAVSIKHSLSSNNRFSPAQLVFGQNLSLPNFIENTLPAQEVITKSIYTASHLTRLHAAGKDFIKSKSSDKLKNCITNAMIHLSGKVQQKFWAKMDQFYSSDKVLDILKHIYAELNLFKYKNLCKFTINWIRKQKVW